MADKNIIELQMPDGTWERSWGMPEVYTMDAAQALIDGYDGDHHFRITPLVRKPYRRHAAVTQLELRGAKDVLRRAHDYIAKQASESSVDVSLMLKTFSILWDARLAVTRQLEAL